MEEIKVSREMLKHFQCGKCKKWWTVGDTPEVKIEWFCPWCGGRGELEAVKGKIVVGGTYKHYKGHVYKVIGVAKHSETLEELVIYERIGGSFREELWARPRNMFLEKIEVAGKKRLRFEFLKDKV